MGTKKIVLTGGPCGGKTTIAEVASRAFQDQLIVVPESASLLFKGGFPRWMEPDAKLARQKAIFHVQEQLEKSYESHHSDRLLLLDRATIDGSAYAPLPPEEFFRAVGSSLDAQLSKYDLVIYLESANEESYKLNAQRNPLRIESWEEARRLDEITLKTWQKHPQLHIVKNQCSFAEKISRVLKLIEEQIEV